MSYYACVIVNPASANGATGRDWPEIRSALDRVLDRWDNQFTLAPGDATRLARQAVEDGYEMIVSIGGDGTMNEVVTGLFDASAEGAEPQLLRDDVIIAPVRAGTGGDFARYLGLPHSFPDSVAHLAGDKTRPCDLGWITFTTHDGTQAGRAFANIASFGLSGMVDDKVNKTTKALGGKASFLIGTLRALASYNDQGVRVVVDGESFIDETMVTLAVANGQFFGGGMHFAPKAAIDDGLFDVVVQLRTGIKEILSIGDLYSGKLIDWKSVRHTRAKIVEAFASNPDDHVLVDVDGEQPGRLPAVFRMFESAVRLKV